MVPANALEIGVATSNKDSLGMILRFMQCHAVTTQKLERTVGGFRAAVAPVALLEAIKRSHIWFPIKWWKHINDLHFLRALPVFV
jgi:hypothetical protein